MFKRVTLALTVFILLLPVSAFADQVVFVAAGPNVASIQSSVDQFRASLGGVNNGNAPGLLPSGRREINWDGAPGTNTAAAAGTPFAGFQNNRGALFTTPGTGFLQTPDNAPELLSINPTYDTTFNTFSPLRLFTAIGSNIVDATFFIPGSTTPALVSGFGAVFTDVDLNNSTSLQFYDVDNNLLYSQFVAASPGNGTFSFLGVTFDSAIVSRVRITSGNSALYGSSTKKWIGDQCKMMVAEKL